MTARSPGSSTGRVRAPAITATTWWRARSTSTVTASRSVRVKALVEPRVPRAYVAHTALRRTDWAIHYHPEDVPRQLDRAERTLGR